jgi:hypothetical protein
MGGHNTAGVYQHSGLARHAGDGKFYLFTGLADEGHENNVVDVANTVMATLRANLEANSILLVGNSVATQANLTLVYDQANTARGTANDSYSQANSSRDQANTARTTANDSYNQANTARDTANGAYSQANDAYGQANTARSTANDAYSQANTADTNALNAYAQANASYGQANTARNQANAAYGQANAAYDAANNAQVTVYANNASDITTQKLNFVNTATITVSVSADGSNANIAFTAVGGAAYDQANAAYGQANAARLQANTARDTANGAYAQANSDYQPAVTELAVTNNGVTAYRFDQYGTVDDPAIYIRAGETIAFNLNNAGHPFAIRVSSGGANYDTGLTHVATDGTVSTGSNAQGKESGKLYWKVPYELLGNTYVYQCTVHAGMVGNIVIEPPGTIVYAQANDAYSQANTARTTANDAYGQANTARTTANDAYSAANTAGTNALNAYGQANTAYGQANDAYGQANTARDQANTARSTANASYGQANTARNQANAAYGQANAAYTAANNAQVTVYANSASDVTTQKINFVNTATITVAVTNSEGNANIAFTAVGGAAYDQANAAYGQANTARTTANDAYGQANTARDQANTARTQANTAYGQANAAYTAANNIADGTTAITLKSAKDFILANTNVNAANTIDLSVSNYFRCVMTASAQFTFINAPTSGTGQLFSLLLIQDSGGSRTPTFANTIYWAGGSIPPATTDANARDLWTFITYDGGSTYWGSLTIKDAR